MKTEGKNDNNDTGPRAFSVFLHKIAEGECHTQLSAELLALSKALLEQSKAQAKGVTGSLTLKLNFAAEEGVLDVRYSISTTEPKPRRAPSVFWQDKNGNVVDENPKQQKLPLSVVGARGPAQEAKPEGTAAREA